jgi:intein/homing endonuclease
MPDNIAGINAGADAPNPKPRTRVVKTASTASDTAHRMARAKRAVIVQQNGPVEDKPKAQPLTKKEIEARMYKKYSTTSFGFNSRQAYNGTSNIDVSGSSQGNFYSPQLSTDFLEKPQNLRERRAWYRTFYNSNEFVGQAVDLHSTLPISKIKLDKPKSNNQDFADYVYDFFVEMCNDIKLTKTLLEISHEYTIMGNCIPENSIIRCIDENKIAREVCEGDYILTNKNRFRKVLKAVTREANKLLEITVCKTFEKIECTPEHPIEVLRDGKFKFVQAKNLTENDYIRIVWPEEKKDIQSLCYTDFDNLQKNENGYQYDVTIPRKKSNLAHKNRLSFLGWAKSLKKPTIITRDKLSKKLDMRRKELDSIVLQLRKEGFDFTKRLGATGYQKGSQVAWYPLDGCKCDQMYIITRTHKVRAPHNIDIDNDFCYLVGYWLGDGTLARDNSRITWGRGLWQIGFGNGSEGHIPKIESIIKEKLGDKCLKKWTSNGITYLKVKGNPAFIEWWSENFGETSHGNIPKKIPQWFVNLPIRKLENFLAGIIDSDGCVSKNEEGSVQIAMSSKPIMDMVKDISLKCGTVFNYRKESSRLVKTPNGKYSMSKGMYMLYTSDKESCRIFTKNTFKKMLPDAIFPTSNRFFKRLGKNLAFKIRSINDLPGQQVYNFEIEEDHTYSVNGFSTHNCFVFCEDHDPYSKQDEQGKEVLKEKGKAKTKELYEKFKVIDKDPNYQGFRQLIILPPDQVRVKKVPLSDDILVEFVPDPETKKTIMGMVEGSPLSYDYRISDIDRQKIQDKLPEVLFDRLKDGGAIPLDTDPYSGSHVYHLARKKSQYETMGVSILERCVNTLLYQDKLRQAQTSIASRHMTPIRVIWAEGMSDNDTDVLREQVDLSLVDPDFSIVSNFEIHWDEMGANGRLLDLTSEFEHIENALFAGLGVTREILTGEGTYSGNRINLEILNTQYMLFRDQLQDFVENNLFKPVAKKKGFEEEDKFGRKKLLYPHLSFSRLAVRDNDAFFDQAFNMYNKGSLSSDIILDLMNIDANSNKKKLEADLFTVNDSAFNQFLQALYNAVGPLMAEKYDLIEKLGDYLDIHPLPTPPGGEGGEAGGAAGAGGLPGMGRFSTGGLNKSQVAVLNRLISSALKNPQKLDKIIKFLNG